MLRTYYLLITIVGGAIIAASLAYIAGYSQGQLDALMEAAKCLAY